MSRRRIAGLGLLVGLVLPSGAAALAANGYTVRDAAWHRPRSGSLFSVNAHGVAVHKALLYVYLDRQPCRWTWASEVSHLAAFSAGQSVFRGTGRSVVTLWVSGRFNRSFTARAGKTARPEYACAYLTTPDSHGRYTITAARSSNAYVVR